MQMRRTIPSIFLALALLLLPLTDRAQQSSPDKPQQAPAPAQIAAPKQDPTQQSDQTIKTVVNLVDVLFTVLNRRNKLVPELEKGDFKIWDDKAPQEIRYFSKQTDLPLRIGMLLDTSNSIRDRIKFEQDAARSEEHTSELQSPQNLVCRLLLGQNAGQYLVGPGQRLRGDSTCVHRCCQLRDFRGQLLVGQGQTVRGYHQCDHLLFFFK